MQKSSNPIWETVVMCASFLLLWGWFIAQKAAENAHKPLHWAWHGALLVALAALIFITVRRVQRVQRALRGEDEPGPPVPGNAAPMSPMFGQGPPSANGKHPSEKN